ncbi:DUF1127 domain-containing protein [Microvirga brassicacearum]
MLMSILMNRVRAWLAYRETVFQLERLDERDLSDLGIGRRDIRRLAREATKAARGKPGKAVGKIATQES